MKKNNNKQKKQRRPVNKNNRTADGIPFNLRPMDIMPPYKNVQLKYLDPNNIISGAASFVILSLRINDVFDPDPNILTTGVAGFQQLMIFYEFFRVDSVSVQWNVTNNETYSVNVGYVFSQNNLSSTTLTRQAAFDALENGISTGVSSLQARTGGLSTVKIRRSIKPKFLLGNPKLYEGDNNYIGNKTSGPSDFLWVNFIIIAPTNTNFLNSGVVGQVSLHYRVHLFGRTILEDPITEIPQTKAVSAFSKK